MRWKAEARAKDILKNKSEAETLNPEDLRKVLSSTRFTESCKILSNKTPQHSQTMHSQLRSFLILRLMLQNTPRTGLFNMLISEY
jgi:hypothetical protein